MLPNTGQTAGGSSSHPRFLTLGSYNISRESSKAWERRVEVQTENSGYLIPPRLWMWLGHQRAISVLLWITTISVAAYILVHAWSWFKNASDLPEERQRVDGNSGHT